MNDRGFTLSELLVAAALMGVIMAGLLTLLMTGQQTFAVGTNQVEAQQNLRIAMSRMLREIREAGYDPTNASFDAITNQTATALTIQNDWDGDGAIAAAAVTPPWGAPDRGQQIIYTLNGSTLERREVGVDAAPQEVAVGIEGILFEYLQVDGVTPAATSAEIRTVVVTVTARPEHQPATTAAGHVEVLMRDQVRLRNRGA
ncbi:MAG: PilW family protein [Candidatus Rokuibacteriota bacterium]